MELTENVFFFKYVCRLVLLVRWIRYWTVRCVLPYPMNKTPPMRHQSQFLWNSISSSGRDYHTFTALGTLSFFLFIVLNVFCKIISLLLNHRVPEKEFVKAYKTNHRLKTRVNNFHRQKLESSNNNEDDFVAIRPEWTTVDRILAYRF